MPRCTLVFTGFLPRALVAQRIEQKTSKFLTPPLHRTVYRVVGERNEVVRLACDELLICIEIKEQRCFANLEGIYPLSVHE